MKKIKLLAVGILMVAFGVMLAGCATQNVEENVKVDNTDTNSVNQLVTYDTDAKFSKEDLVVDNLKYGMTEEDVKNIMGDPDRKADGEAFDIYGESIQYYYGELELIFYNHDGKFVLSGATTESPDYIFAKGLKVGDSKEKVISSFNRETEKESEMRNIYSTYDASSPFGKYLYGHGLDDVTDEVRESGIHQYAFINKYNYDSSRSDATYMIEYRYAEPPYASGYATAGDPNSSLIFDVDSNDTVTCIRWYYLPEMK